MPIVAADLVFYGAANHAEDDTSTQGGAIDLTTKVAMVFMAANDTIDVVSSSAADTTQTVTVTGRVATGAIDTEVFTLAGTTPQVGTTTFERVLKIVMSATAVGTITIERATGPVTIATMEPGITTVRGLFFDAASDASPKTLYEKLFAKNEHGTLTLTNATSELTLEPTAVADYLMAVEDAVDDTNSAANRVTAPVGQSAFRQINITEPIPGGGDLAAGEAIGIWLQMDLAADNAAFVDDWTDQLAGTTV